jgi:hypothetical protein
MSNNKKRSSVEKYPLVLASNLVGRTMLVIERRFLADGRPVIKAQLSKKKRVIFKTGKATNAQLDQVKILPSWAKLVEVEGQKHRYHKFIWANTVGWRRKNSSFWKMDGAEILEGDAK